MCVRVFGGLVDEGGKGGVQTIQKLSKIVPRQTRVNSETKTRRGTEQSKS